MLICPEVTRSIPARQRRRVVLPEPDGPSRTTKVPGSTVRLTSRRARLPLTYSLLRFATAMLSATARRSDPAPAGRCQQPVAAEYEADGGERDADGEH